MRYYVVFFNDTATTEIYALSLHDALPICEVGEVDDPARAAELGLANPFRTLTFDLTLRRAGQVLPAAQRSEEHTSELQSRQYLVCRLLLEKKKLMRTRYNIVTHVRLVNSR